MPFQIGHPRYGGRKVGQKATHVEFREKLERAGFDIATKSMELYKWCIKHNRPDVAARILENCSEYSIAKPREESPSASVFISSNPYLVMPEAELIQTYRETMLNAGCERNQSALTAPD